MTNRGFGLIEVMMSAVILGVGMTGILSLSANLQDNYHHQKLLVQALHIAESSMEDLLVRYADDPDLTSGNHTGARFGINGKVGGTFYTTSWRVTEGVPFTGTRQIILTVSWSEKTRSKVVRLTTVRT